MLGFALSPATVHAVPDPMGPYFAKSGGTHVAIAEASGGALTVWSDLGEGHAAWMTLDNNDPSLRLSWRETLIAKLRAVYPIGSWVLSGAWNQMQSSGSGLAASYTGNRAVSTGSAAAVAAVTVGRDEPYDLWVHYTGRTSGGYVQVKIDGGQTLVNEIDDPAGLGFKAFSSYAETDLLRRQVIRVASGLTGTHTVELSYGGPASPGGAAILLEAVSTSADLRDEKILPPLWQPNTAYAMGDEVRWLDSFYSARATGPSGSVPPTHSSGIASDGALDWRADNRPTYPAFVAIDYASEREYAVRFALAGQVSEVGGQTHGNEPLLSRTIALDGNAWVPNASGNGLSVGQHLTITEATRWQTSGAVEVALCQLTRTILPGELRHDVALTATGPSVDVEWFYPAMLPMVHWDGESAGEVVASVASGPLTVELADYDGINPPNIAFDGAARIGLAGQIGTTGFRYGLSAALAEGDGPDTLSGFLRPNLEGRTASGSLDWPAKAYIAAEKVGGFGFAAGDVIRFANRHVMSVS